jgi:hypothetical protein
MPLTGHLSDLSLSELIEFFCNQRKTGQLKVLYPDGHGCFYLQTGSVVDARIGVLRGIDAVYYALTLPNAKFEFGPSTEPIERTINQPWTQVVLEGLRRLDEGVVPAPAFPPEYAEESIESTPQETSFTELEQLRVPAFLSFISKESMSKRRFLIAGLVTAVLVLSVAAIGVPAGWYHRAVNSAAIIQPSSTLTVAEPATSIVTEAPQEDPAHPTDDGSESELAAKRQRERDRARAREEMREERVPTPSSTAPASSGSSAPAPAPTDATANTANPGPRKVAVTVTYDEAGRVTQASGGDASAVRIARQKRFPAGKAGSATITIPIN